MQGLASLNALIEFQVEIKQKQNKILQECCEFFSCYLIEVIRFIEAQPDTAQAAIKLLNSAEPIQIERQSITLALPPLWHQGQAHFQVSTPTQLIFYGNPRNVEPDKKAVLLLNGPKNHKAMMTTDSLNPGFGLGFDELAAKSDLACQFYP
ncbi:hypothetical protein [Leptolyngbya sp. AN03gr2]